MQTNATTLTALDQLKTMTTLVADTGDLQAIARLRPLDATTNPSLITQALLTEAHQSQILSTLSTHSDIDTVIDALTIHIGSEILGHIAGRVSTEVDARLSYDTEATVRSALAFMEAYAKKGVDNDRVLIKIAATWEGIQAARQLERQGIHCNLTLIFSMHQAIACADAGVTLISPFVGRILDWQKAQLTAQGLDNHVAISNDMGVNSVKSIYHYYKQHGYATQVMGASFRSVEQILALAGCDLLTIAPNLLDELATSHQTVERQLSPSDLSSCDLSTSHLASTKPNPLAQISHTDFMNAQTNDHMANELLTKGIDGFIDAREKLAKALSTMA